jgi:hypothetical protein
MTEKAGIFETHYQKYCKELGACDLERAAGILGMTMDGDRAVLPFLGAQFWVSGQGIEDAAGNRPSYGLCVILAKYVLRCPEKGPHDPQWVAFRDFKKEAAVTNVNFFTSDVETAIARRFQGRLDRLAESGRSIGGKDHETGATWDLSMAFTLLPRIRMLLLFNDRDDMFPCQCRVLFEKHAEIYLDPESLAMAGAALAKAILRADEKVAHENTL